MRVDLQTLLGLIDLTSLNESDTPDSISTLCQKAVTPYGHVAAVCFYPRFVKQATSLLVHQPVNIATVVNFPQGTASLESVLVDIRHAIEEGADEIDVVFPYADYLRGDKHTPFDFIRQCKATCGEKVLLKVILETGALVDPDVIAEVSYHLCHAGADFLKTSTGKIEVGATDEAVRVLLETVKKSPRPVGVKISGGVRTLAHAEHFIQLAKQLMGEQWIMPANLRIGASQLVDHVVAALAEGANRAIR